MQGSARKDVVFGAARVYTVTVPGPKWKSWLNSRSPILLMCSITARFTPRLGEGLYSGLLGMPQALPAR